MISCFFLFQKKEFGIIFISDLQQETSRSSSPIFYEKPGLPDVKYDEQDDLTLSPNGTRRVKFSNAPIRVNKSINCCFFFE